MPTDPPGPAGPGHADVPGAADSPGTADTPGPTDAQGDAPRPGLGGVPESAPTPPDATSTAGRGLRIDAEWRGVSRRYLAVEVVGSILTALVLCAVCVPFLLLGTWFAWPALGVAVAIGIVLLVLAPRRVRAIGYALRPDDLLFKRGIMWHRVVAVPYGRMQLIDVNQGPVARLLGLSELKFVTAAASTGVTIPGLPVQVADELRDRLVELAETRRVGL